MVMNGEINWLELYKVWHRKHTEYLSAQRALDDTMSMYMESKGPPPSRQVMKKVDDLRHQMSEARAAVNEFIAAYAADEQDKHNLPRHE
jgi:hypothetical protein